MRLENLSDINLKLGCLHTEKAISYKSSLTRFPIFSFVVQYHMTKCPEGTCCSHKRGGLLSLEGRLMFVMLFKKYNELLTNMIFYIQENFEVPELGDNILFTTYLISLLL